MLDTLSTWMREQRLVRGWSVAEMGRQLRQAARASNDHTVPRTAILASYVRRWEAGRIGLTERYRLHYCTALGIRPSQFGPSQLQTQQPELASTSAETVSGDVVAASILAAPDVRSGTDVPGSPGEPNGYRGAGNGYAVPERPERVVPVADSPDLLMAMIAEESLDDELARRITSLKAGNRTVAWRAL